MTEFMAFVFNGTRLVSGWKVLAETWQEARKLVQWNFPKCVVSIHSMEVYREAAKGGK